ncbi:hypothetical protein WDZ16_03450 [Pseudokineococcus marinus]|uniref:Uncharacterized protein n=1 Tax=Pseudokineococcus marinus TaxID=351215 RepID=A0A849BNM5_9ACTN|nr:hypothetical protein [Pseudokineococcus marinus]NNH23015.1 hypothetical protein [Pseudokineococcus marinus]
MLHRHPRLTSFVARFLVIVVTLGVVDALAPGLSTVLRVVVAVAASLAVGALVDRQLGLTGRRNPSDGPPGQH